MAQASRGVRASGGVGVAKFFPVFIRQEKTNYLILLTLYQSQ